MTLAELLAEVDRLGEAATKGPWRACKDEDDVPVVCVPPDHAGPVAWDPNPYSAERRACLFLTEADAAFIAFARTALPRLARVAEAAVERLTAIRALGCENEIEVNPGDFISCYDQRHPDLWCASCLANSGLSELDRAARGDE